MCRLSINFDVNPFMQKMQQAFDVIIEQETPRKRSKVGIAVVSMCHSHGSRSRRYERLMMTRKTYNWS